MHTTDHARELWCPMVRIARRETPTPGPGDDGRTEVIGGCNTDALGRIRVPASCRCIADECAMWRWLPAVDPTWKRPTEAPSSFRPPPMVRSTHGYCGLATRPEIL